MQISNAGISCKFDTPSIISYQNNVIKNNKIHTFGQITRTYSPAVSISGMGNYVQNNTIYDSPHTAIQYNGNYNIIEKNEIYNVCRFSGDCGAIYSGRSFSYYGNVIRYNYLHDIGEGAFKPNGIYLDDYLSGQEVCYNVIANVRGAGILGGGGRDNKIYNNVFLNATMSYDERARVSYNNGNVDYTDTENGNFWKLVKSAKSLYTKWNVQLTSVFDITNDVAILDTANFGVNPANNVIKDNLFASGNGNHYSIRSYVQKFSTVENNIKTTIESVGFDKKQSYDLTYVNELVKGICQNNQLKEFQVAC